MPEPAPPSRKGRSIPSFSEGVSSPKGQASEDGKIRAPCMIRGACAAKRVFPGKIFTPCVPERRFAGLFGCIARISCQSQLILNTRRQYAATNWRFSRPKPLLGCVERKTCHGLPPGNAFREHFAIGKRPGTHRGEILPRQGTRERTAAESCHGKTPENAPCENIATASQAKSASGRSPATVGRRGNAFREYFAIGKRPGTHIRNVLPTERHLRVGGPIALP